MAAGRFRPEGVRKGNLEGAVRHPGRAENEVAGQLFERLPGPVLEKSFEDDISGFRVTGSDRSGRRRRHPKRSVGRRLGPVQDLGERRDELIVGIPWKKLQPTSTSPPGAQASNRDHRPQRRNQSSARAICAGRTGKRGWSR